jgi:hypothetical protein
MAEQSDFQKQFFAKGTGGTLFTQKEFDDALAVAQAEIMAMAIEASRTAVIMEREACAKLVDEEALDHTDLPYAEHFTELAARIRNRIPSQVRQ